MSCHSCSMHSVEAFTQMPQKEYFDNKKGYECQTQTQQTCIYTAQGDIVCTKNGTDIQLKEPFFVRESRPPL